MLRRISIIIAGLLIAGLLVAGWYAYNKGFTQKWRKFVVQEFHKRGVELSLSKLTLEPFRGIVAKQVRIYDSRDRRRVLAVVDEVRLVINYANLFQGRTFIDALDLRDANLDVPLDPAKRTGTKFEIRHLSGLLFLPEKQLYLSRLEADIYGIHLRASGRVINPQKFSFFPENDAAKTQDRAQFIEQVITELKSLEYEGSPPQVEVRFSGDLALPEDLFVEATLWSEKVQREMYRLDNLYVNAGFRDGIVRLRQLTASDASGAVRASGSYDVETREGSLQLHSGLDAQRLARSFTRVTKFDEAVFYAPPEIDLTVRASLAVPSSFQTLGHIEFKKFAYKSVIFDSFNADLSWDGKRWSALDVELVHRTGKITGDLLHADEEDRSSLKSTIQRKVLAPLFAGKGSEWIPQIEFVEPVNAGAFREPLIQSPQSFGTANLR